MAAKDFRRPVKKDASFHPAQSDFKHQKLHPSGAVVPGTESHESGLAALALESTQELRQRAMSLDIEGWKDLRRKELIASLHEYRLNELH